ncbi:hypothetical protein K402DRAFT_230365 [Aulographum hederae CBS 113979]|uniref:Uncharacterized protein n=1 Tax=Aulographum hederae CBS 113979 TaxID=1176131 RepID=A0A6G1HB95_9PEZI|nr:hypothetical protein K402DRAFT_230365 [Aulographum hederae CBS 113979]
MRGDVVIVDLLRKGGRCINVRYPIGLRSMPHCRNDHVSPGRRAGAAAKRRGLNFVIGQRAHIRAYLSLGDAASCCSRRSTLRQQPLCGSRGVVMLFSNSCTPGLAGWPSTIQCLHHPGPGWMPPCVRCPRFRGCAKPLCAKWGFLSALFAAGSRCDPWFRNSLKAEARNLSASTFHVIIHRGPLPATSESQLQPVQPPSLLYLINKSPPGPESSPLAQTMLFAAFPAFRANPHCAG